MTFIETCAAAIEKAKESGSLIYVHETPNAYLLSSCYVGGWLFRAYPGGRKQLSVRGVEIAKAEGYDPSSNPQ